MSELEKITSPVKSNDDTTNIVDDILSEEGGKEKLNLLLRRELTAEVIQANSIEDKITSEHITMYLSGSEKNMEKTFEDNDKQRKFILLILLISIIAVISMIFLLKNDKEILNYVMTSLVSIVAGAFGGYGYGKHK